MQRHSSAVAKSHASQDTTIASLSLVPARARRTSGRDFSSPLEWEGATLAPTDRRLAAPATFVPMAYESGYRYPLVVWLHGAASDERTLPGVMRHVSLRNFVAVAPRGVECRGDELADAPEVAEGDVTWRQSAAAIDHASEAIEEAIATAQERFNVHPDRVFLAGVGAGGTMALRVALADPGRFAGAATLDGPLPTGHSPLARVNELRELPLMLSAGRQSTEYCEPQLCRDLALLHSAGCRVAVRQYPEDGLTTPMLADLNRWMMDLVCG